MACDVMNRSILVPRVGAIKLVSWAKHGAIVARLQLGSTRIRIGQESLLGYVLDTFIVSCSLFCGVLEGCC